MSTTIKAPIIIKGKLKFKSEKSGDKNSTSKSINNNNNADLNNHKRKNEELDDEKKIINDDDEIELTAAQKRHKQKLLELEKRNKSGNLVSFRDKIENFNTKLSKLTEHNDIPRVSAAGNG